MLLCMFCLPPEVGLSISLPNIRYWTNVDLLAPKMVVDQSPQDYSKKDNNSLIKILRVRIRSRWKEEEDDLHDLKSHRSKIDRESILSETES